MTFRKITEFKERITNGRLQKGLQQNLQFSISRWG